jgi:hypothetical protein
VRVPIVIHDDTWRAKQKAILLRPRWAHRPAPAVREWLEYRHAIRDKDDAKKLAVVELDEERAPAVRDHLKGDFIAFLFSCSIYKDRNTRRKMRAELTPGQIVIAWRIQAMIDAKVPIRVIFLKVRQAGSSWLWMQFCYWFMGFRENRGELIMSHEDKTTRQIFGYLRDCWENMPKELRPSHEHSSKTELKLNEKLKDRLEGKTGLDSQALVVTAANDLAGTGFPTQGLLSSEAGRYHLIANVESLMTSVGGGIQEDEPETFKVYESTAFGANTWFHLECKAAQLGYGTPGWNGFTFIFIPWFFDPRNAVKRTALEVDELGDSDADEYGNEVLLMQRFNLSLEQLDWRRGRIRSLPADTRSKVDLFKQDFPSTPEEAWLHAVGKAFAPDFVDMLRKRIEDEKLKPVFVGDMTHQRKLGPNLGYLRDGARSNEWLTRRPGGAFRIYRLPNPRHDYLVSADLSFGITGGDHSCFKVWQRVGFEEEGRKLMRLAAEWYGLVDDDVFAHMLWRVGHFYSVGYGVQREPAMLAWELTGPGANVAKWLRRGEDPEKHDDPYPVSRMIRRHRSNALKQKWDQSFGIATTGTSKPVMLGEFVKAAREDEIQLISEDVDEVEALERDEKDRIETHGRDRFMTVVLGVYAAQTVPIKWGVEQKVTKDPPPHTGAWFAMHRERRRAREDGEGYYDEERILDLE